MYNILGDLQMPRVGMYTYPLFRLNALLGTTKTLHEKFGNKDFTREHVAQVLGQKPTSGGLSQKLADLKAYGLISDSQSRYTVTDLGIKATFGREAERTNALDKAVRNVPLWKAIYEKCGKDPLADTFDLDLAEITGITAPESKNVAGAVRKSFIEDIKYLLSVKTPVEEPEPEKPTVGGNLEPARDRKSLMDTPQIEMPATGGIAVIQFPQLGELKGVIRNKKSLDMIRNFLDEIEDYFKTEEQKSAEQTKDQ
jgi:hypothetical protein